MTALALSNAELEAALLLNLRQDQAILNPSPQADSLCEHLVEIVRLAPPGSEIRKHAVAGLGIARTIRQDNRAERGHVEAAPVTAAPAVPREARGVKAAYRRLADPLAVLCNPVIRGAKRDEALAAVAAVIAEFPEATLRKVSLAHDLRTAKTTLLYRLMDEAKRTAEARS
jgi:hypothetical protein